MKKSILALSAAAALGGLGFAGSAHAIGYFGDGVALGANATAPLVLAAGNIGHFLFTPYYSVQGNMNTLFNITNTDEVNAKAVKVRFRGAANSDDVLDFTVFLSPGDVWTASLTQGDDGRAQITTPDSSCTLPPQNEWPGHFSAERLDQSLSAEAHDAHTREGYIEVLNMADIPPTLLSDAAKGTVGPTAGLVKGKPNPVFTAIKHVAGKAPCTSTAFDGLLTTTLITDGAEAEGYGLAVPSGGLMGSWAVLSQDQLAVYGGVQTAVMASTQANDPVPPTNLAGAPLNRTAQGLGLIAFAPQVNEPVDPTLNINTVTADPLLRSGLVAPVWFDLPDMSSPLVTVDSPVTQAAALSAALSKPAVYNDWVATGASAVVPMQTDWVVSQPTRRYHVAVAYDLSAIPGFGSIPRLIWNADMSDDGTGVSIFPPTASQNAYSLLSLRERDNMGSYACLNARFSAASREEAFLGTSSSFSPGAPNDYCGEVFTMSFNSDTSKVLQAKVANHKAKVPTGAEAGWARLSLGATNTYLPVVGFAATSIKNSRADGSGGNYGMTLQHRW